MPFGFSTATLLLVTAVVFAGGVVMGLAGFGYAVVSTATLAVVLAPTTAVVLMIVPLLASNVSLLTELDRDSFRACARRFWPYVLAAAAGTVVGMALLRRIPGDTLALALGVFVLGYVLLQQEVVALPGRDTLAERCFRETLTAKVGLGFVSGFVFGASNVGVQVVAYFDSLGLDRDTFVGVLAMVLVGVSALRVGLAYVFGFYGTGSLFGLSVAAALPGLVGVEVGKKVRAGVPERHQDRFVYGLLLVVGGKLTLGGLGLL